MDSGRYFFSLTIQKKPWPFALEYECVASLCDNNFNLGNVSIHCWSFRKFDEWEEWYETNIMNKHTLLSCNFVMKFTEEQFSNDASDVLQYIIYTNNRLEK